MSTPPGYPPPPPSLPPYGPQPPYSAPGYGGQAPHISSADLKPARWWYAVAAAIIVVLAGAGIAIGAIGFVKSSPDLHHHFKPNETATFTLDSGKEASLYGASNDKVKIQCQVSDGVTLSKPSGKFSFTSDGETWERVFNIKSSVDGKHDIECTSDNSGDIKLAIGKKANAGGVVGFAFTLFCGPCLGVIVGAVIIIVVAIRRKSHKDRLLRERGDPGFGYPTGGAGYPSVPGAAGSPQAPGYQPPAPGGYQQPPMPGSGYPQPPTGFGEPPQPPQAPSPPPAT